METEAEAASLDGLLDDHRLVTLTGVSGVDLLAAEQILGDDQSDELSVGDLLGSLVNNQWSP